MYQGFNIVTENFLVNTYSNERFFSSYTAINFLIFCVAFLIILLLTRKFNVLSQNIISHYDLSNKTLYKTSIGLVLLNIILGKILPPASILLTPYLLPLLGYIICLSPRENKTIQTAQILTLLIIINDLGIKKFAGGSHDSQGLGWINLTFILGFIPSYIISVIGIWKTNSSKKEKVIATVIIPTIVFFYFSFFNEIVY
jgi:hypothetical protein